MQNSLEAAQNLTLIRGEARFTNTKVLEVKLSEGGLRYITAKKIFIDCGTSTGIPRLDVIQDLVYLTSTTIMELEDLPEHLLIVGGGYIGLEYGLMFRRFGSKVSILEHGPQLLSREDADLLQQEEINLHFNTEITKVAKIRPGEIELTLRKDGRFSTLQGSHLLIALGTIFTTKILWS